MAEEQAGGHPRAPEYYRHTSRGAHQHLDTHPACSPSLPISCTVPTYSYPLLNPRRMAHLRFVPLTRHTIEPRGDTQPQMSSPPSRAHDSHEGPNPERPLSASHTSRHGRRASPCGHALCGSSKDAHQLILTSDQSPARSVGILLRPSRLAWYLTPLLSWRDCKPLGGACTAIKIIRTIMEQSSVEQVQGSDPAHTSSCHDGSFKNIGPLP